MAAMVADLVEIQKLEGLDIAELVYPNGLMVWMSTA